MVWLRHTKSHVTPPQDAQLPPNDITTLPLPACPCTKMVTDSKDPGKLDPRRSSWECKHNNVLELDCEV
jgi:hypothetical protein